MSIIIKREPILPAKSRFLNEEEFVRATGLASERLKDLLQLEWLVIQRTEQSLLFAESDIYRVRKLERICCDFDLPVVGGTIIVDLLERIDDLERQVRSLGALKP